MVPKHAPLGEINLPFVATDANAPRRCAALFDVDVSVYPYCIEGLSAYPQRWPARLYGGVGHRLLRLSHEGYDSLPLLTCSA